VVGVAWLDTRASHAARSYDEFFTASVDGGATFLPPARVSSVSSALDVAGNLVLRPTIDSPGRKRDAVTFSFITTRASFRDGGDYLGLTADAAGVFHPLWADTRAGSFQAWTSAIAIDTAGEIDADRVRAINSSNVSDKVRPLFDPARYDASTGVEEIPVSWQNISTDTLCGPIIAHVRRLSGGRTAADRAELLNGEPDPQGGVASFDYSRGSAARCLAPGEATRSIVWRARPAANADTFVSFETTVTARVAPAR
jgi:hypothetical protein